MSPRQTRSRARVATMAAAQKSRGRRPSNGAVDLGTSRSSKSVMRSEYQEATLYRRVGEGVKNMIHIDGLAEVVLNVRDAPGAVAFYGGLLGLQRLSAEGQPGPIFFRAGWASDDVPSLLVL